MAVKRLVRIRCIFRLALIVKVVTQRRVGSPHAGTTRSLWSPTSVPLVTAEPIRQRMDFRRITFPISQFPARLRAIVIPVIKAVTLAGTTGYFTAMFLLVVNAQVATMVRSPAAKVPHIYPRLPLARVATSPAANGRAPKPITARLPARLIARVAMTVSRQLARA
jgi:hypothetical protein